jgi:hypothetical protein
MTALLKKRTRLCDLLAAAAVVTLVAAPLLFTTSGFALDFTNHLWLSWAAGNALVESGHPSYFLNTNEIGVFYPWFAFYGGSLYMIVGGISELLGGDPILAYVGVTTLTIAGTYLGMLWLGREFGLRGWVAHTPALAVVTSAYYITNLYGRGAWTELMATAVIAPLLASGVHLLRAPRWSPGPMLVFVVCAVLFTGSHNITLLWGSTVAVLACAIMWLALGRPRELPRRRLAMLAGLGFASVLLNAWYLVPDIAYAQDVRAHAIAVSEAGAPFFDTPSVLLDPLRTVPHESTTPALYVQVPVWFLMWGLVAGGLLLWRRGAGARLGRVWLGVVLLIGLLLAMIMITPLWSVMPFPFDEIQYPYRLGSYIFYAIGVLVLVAALGLQRAGRQQGLGATVRGLRVGLLAVCAVSIGLCVWQQWVPSTLFPHESLVNRSEALVSVHEVPRTWYDPGSYNDNSAPVVEASRARFLDFEARQVHGDRFAALMEVPPGLAPIQTNIAGGRYLVHLTGLKWIGRNRSGYAVVQREREGSGPVYVTVQTTRSPAIVTGWVLSVLACLVVLGALAWAFIGGVRARRPVAV